MSETLGKKAERQIKEWLNRPHDGYSIDRVPDQMSGFYKVSRNICDFIFYKYPNVYYIESKETEHDRFDFSQLSTTQRDGLRTKAEIDGCYGVVIVLFSTYKRAFIINIKDVANLYDDWETLDKDADKAYLTVKSLNIKKIDKWKIPYVEIETIPSRKELLDYTGEFKVPTEKSTK